MKTKKTNIPEWLPDWKNPLEYPDPDTTKMNQWAWEFLRRNPCYQKDFENLTKKLIDIGLSKDDLEKTGDLKNDLAELRFTKALLKALKTTDGKKGYDIQGKYNNCIEEIYTRYKVCGYQAEGINNSDVVPDPSISISEATPVFLINDSLHFFEPISKSQKYFTLRFSVTSIENYIKRMNKNDYKENSRRFVSIETTPRFLLPAINLEKPIRSQLATIKKVAELQRRQLKEWGLLSTGRKRKDNYLGYLRILDAVAVGEPRAKIIEILFPNTSNEYPDYHANKYYDNWLKRAESIRDFNYLKIASLHESQLMYVKAAP